MTKNLVRETIQIVKLDDYVKEHVHLLKMDCQCCEYRALLGVKGLFKKYGVEIGFNAGHSSLIFLARSKATLYSFDIVSLPYSKPMVDIFRATWPERFNMIKGSSFDTVPAFAKNGTTKCDIFSVDGDHSYEGALTDYLNAVKTMTDGGILIADDVGLDPKSSAAERFPGSSRAFKELVDAGMLVNPECEEDPKVFWGKGWCWAKVDLTKTSSKVPPYLPKTTTFALNEY